MRNGESRLAVHPGCGTNYVVAGALAGTLAWLGMTGAKTGRQRLERLPLMILLSMLGFIVSQPLAPVIQQRITTSGDPGSLAIVEVYRGSQGCAPHRDARVTTTMPVHFSTAPTNMPSPAG